MGFRPSGFDLTGEVAYDRQDKLGYMSLKSRPFAAHGRRQALALSVAGLAVWGMGMSAPAAQTGGDRREPRADKVEEANRKEGEALLNLADAAMTGRPAPSDFAIGWRNDFLKAQPGTFVPFTVTVERARLSAPSALMYVRAARRDKPAKAKAEAARFAFDAIFPVELSAAPGEPIRITRGFAVPPGPYDVYVALRERPADPLAVDVTSLRSAVLKQPLTVPDFWTAELATSTVMLADRIDTIPAALDPDDLLERPYVIGQNDVHVVPGSAFKRDRELIVVFLIYNPMVSEDRNFDVQVDYHLFRATPGAAAEPKAAGTDRPTARSGEQYVSRTNPQRFNRASVAGRIDPAAGQPLLAGQGILLSSFQEGEYRIGITVTDLLSRKTLSRDVTFTVVGS
jgi:hypothetical protein